jgi:hypothetical protein
MLAQGRRRASVTSEGVRCESSDGAAMVAVGGGCFVRRESGVGRRLWAALRLTRFSVLSREPVENDERAHLLLAALGQRQTTMQSGGGGALVWWRASWNSCAFTPRWIIS